MRAIKIFGLKGLEIYSSAPQLNPRSSSVSVSLAVKMTIGTLEDFLKFRSDVVRYETNTLDLTPDMKKQTAVLKYLG